MKNDSRTAVVTGASRGLGFGIARRLAKTGYRVVLAARGEDDLRRAAEDCAGACLAVPADVTSRDDMQRLAVTAAEHCGSVDVLVNAAGVVPVLDSLESLTADRFRNGFDVDVLGTLQAVQAVAPLMRRQGRGVIASLIAAGGGRMAGAAHLSVSPSQAALLALTRNLAAILSADGVTVHALLPSLSPDGATGRTAAPALGVTLGPDALTAADVGDAVLEVLAARDSSVWSIKPGGALIAADSMV